MKPSFALSLSIEGIALLHRNAGGWHLVGQVALDVPDLSAALADLRDRARLIDPGGLSCKLIIPNDQIRYMQIDTGTAEGETRLRLVREALAGATPYAVDDLAFDISTESAVTHVAAVARDTLAEAETFAVDHGFQPVSFVAIPGDQSFLGEPFFGVTKAAGDRKIDPDGIAVVVTGEVSQPEREDIAPVPSSTASGSLSTAQDDTAAALHKPDAPAQPAAKPEASPSAPATAAGPTAAGFISRRGKSTEDEATTVTPLAGQRRPEAAAIARPVTPPPAASAASGVSASAASTKTQMQSALAGLLQRRASNPAPQTDRDASTQRPDAHRLNRFGGDRSDAARRGKPRFLGLILTLVLLLLLAGVAAWATLYTGGGLFHGTPKTDAPAPSEQAPASAPAETELPLLLTPPASAPRNSTLSSAPEAGENDLSATDSAVLDALPPAGTAETADSDPELAGEPEPDAPLSDMPEADPETFYAATGLWPTAPQAPETPSIIGLDDLYVASIDRTDLSQDAVALPSAGTFATDQGLNAVTSPAAAGGRFALDARGLVTATPEGSESPDGIVVTLGRPPVVPPALPARLTTQAEATAERDALREYLTGRRPRPRPTDLIEQTERAQLGGRSRSELGGFRPRLRPKSIVSAAAAARAAPVAPPEPENDVSSATAQAVAVAIAPRSRPENLSTQPRRSASASLGIPSTATTPAAPATVAPPIPSSASVARQATVDNALNLRNLNLIGVYGSASNRRALIRLPSGRYKKVKVGDSIDGGKVVAIGDSELRYSKNGRNLTLKLPKG